MSEHFKPSEASHQGGEPGQDDDHRAQFMNRVSLRAIALSTAAVMTIGLAACTSRAQENLRNATEATATATGNPTGMENLPETNRTPAHTIGEIASAPAWEQDFTQQTGLDMGAWQFDDDPDTPTYNDELQGYTHNSQNVRVEKGTGLILEARRQPYAYPGDQSDRKWQYTSGKIESHGNFTVGLGRVEATMKLPEGTGVWPAFWMLSANNPYTSGATDADWAKENFYLHDGELDIAEYYGNNSGIIDMTAHTYRKPNSGKTTQLPDATNGFHTYAVDMLSDRLIWRIDGKAVRTLTKPATIIGDKHPTDSWPWNPENKQKIILNLAVGGPSGKPAANETDWQRQLIVQNVRYFALQEN